MIQSEWHERRYFSDRRVENRGPAPGMMERRVCTERRGMLAGREFSRHSAPDAENRRYFPDRRTEDDGPPLACRERRLSPERRGFQLEELYIDERVVLNSADEYVSG